MIDVLKHPRPGFEEAVRAHFRVLRGALLAQCQQWLKEAGEHGELPQQQLATEIVELHRLLAEL